MSQQLALIPDTIGDARFSCDRRYRFWLSRRWAEVEKPDAVEFIASVREQVAEMYQWICANSHVTDDQLTALANWEEGVQKWLS